MLEIIGVAKRYGAVAALARTDLSVARGETTVLIAVLLYRTDLAEHAPAAVAAFERLAGRIDEQTMARLKLEREPETEVAADFLAQALGVRSKACVGAMLRT